MLREAVLHAVSHSSWRKVRKAVGDSIAGLQKFARYGPEPYSRMRGLLSQWYVRDAADVLPDTRPGTIRAAADLLLAGVREPQKAAARKKLLTALVRIYADAGVPPLDELGELAGE